MSFILALDQGTSSSRAIVFDAAGRIVASAQQPLPQRYPQPGWVEHDPQEIWRTQLATARAALAGAGLAARDLGGLGITNQRETTMVWNRRTGEPLQPAIVWQDRRTQALCEAWRGRPGLEERVRALTGLRIDPYFSASKIRWILDRDRAVRRLAQRGDLAFGTVDTWLLWKLTGGRVHATDVTNASRTLLFDIHRRAWSDELLEAFDIPAALLPAVHASSHPFGETDREWFGAPVPIAAIAGDQQSALFGQACFRPGLAKNTYGTGCFALLHAGTAAPPRDDRLVVTRTAEAGAAAGFALEGSVFIGGAVVQWLRDGLQAIRTSADVQALAESVPDAGGVVFVPAFSGLGAPYWQPGARGTIAGLTRGSTVAHIARAALECIAYQSTALLQAMGDDAGARIRITELRVDGGAAVNDLLMQFQADLLGVPVVRPRIVETTALGIAYLAGLATGVFDGLPTIEALWQEDRRFHPRLSREAAQASMARWERAVRQATAS